MLQKVSNIEKWNWMKGKLLLRRHLGKEERIKDWNQVKCIKSNQSFYAIVMEFKVWRNYFDKIFNKIRSTILDRNVNQKFIDDE